MKKLIQNNYHKHLLVGGLPIIILFVIGLFMQYLAKVTGIYDIGIYFDTLRNWEFGLIGLTLGIMAGLWWEISHHHGKNKAPFDVWDVVFSGIGGFITGFIIAILFI